MSLTRLGLRAWTNRRTGLHPSTNPSADSCEKMWSTETKGLARWNAGLSFFVGES